MKIFKLRFPTLDEKEFALKSQINEDRDFFKYCPRVILEIMKTCEMINNAGKVNSIHWIAEKLWDQKFSEFVGYGRNFNPLYVFYPVLLDDFRIKTRMNRSFVEEKFKELFPKFNNSADLIKDVKNRLYKGKRDYDGVSLYKYRNSLPKEEILSDKDYIDLIVYIVLCLGDQLNPDIDDFRCSDMFKKQINLDYSKFKRISKNKFCSIIAKCILNTLKKLKKVDVDKLPKDHQIFDLIY